MLKIMHLGDLHLDSPFKNVSYSESVKLREKLREVFKEAIKKAKEAGVSVILLSGDLFDGEYFTRQSLDFIFSCFESAKEIKFVISPGNHDPYRYKSPYKEFEFEENAKKTENVFIFKSEKIEKFEFPELDLTVYGWAFTSETLKNDPLEGFTASGKGFNVLCAHGDTDNRFSVYAPVKQSSIEASGLDYAALGHIHTKPGFMQVSKTVYGYSGSLCGRDFSEYGEKGGVIVTLDEKQGVHETGVQRIKLCPWTYETVEIDISGTASDEEVSEKAKEKLSVKDGEIVRLTLSGRCRYEPDEKKIISLLSDYGVTEVENKAGTEYDFTGLKDEFGIRGEFYRKLLPMLESSDENERKRAALALKIGLKALDGEEITY